MKYLLLVATLLATPAHANPWFAIDSHNECDLSQNAIDPSAITPDLFVLNLREHDYGANSVFVPYAPTLNYERVMVYNHGELLDTFYLFPSYADCLGGRLMLMRQPYLP